MFYHLSTTVKTSLKNDRAKRFNDAGAQAALISITKSPYPLTFVAYREYKSGMAAVFVQILLNNIMCAENI